MGKLNVRGRIAKRQVKNRRTRFTHQRIDKDQRIRIREYVLADKADTLREARDKARLLTEGNVKTHIKLEDGKYNIYTYFKLNPVRRKRLEQSQEVTRNQKTAVAIPEQEPEKKEHKPIKPKTVTTVRGESIAKIVQKVDEKHALSRQSTSILLRYKTLMFKWAKENKKAEDDGDGYYSPKLVRLLLQYYYMLAEGDAPFSALREVDKVQSTMRGARTRYINPVPLFEEAIIWKVDIDNAISKLKSNGDVTLPWDRVCRATDDETVKVYLPFLDLEQRIIVEHFILRNQEHSEASIIFKKLVLLMNGEYKDDNC